jgi:O-antigen ligase
VTTEGFELRRPVASGLSAIVLGAWSAAVALVPSPAGKFVLVVPVLVAALFYWVILSPSRWLVAFFFCLLLLPPLPLPFGNSGVHVAPLFALLGGVVGLVWIREWVSWSHPLTRALVIFIGILLESLAFAAIYSGWEIAMGSLARVVLFALSVFVFLYSYAGPNSDAWNPFRITKVLFGLAVAGALFACADFYFQFPAPGGYGDQFVYLEEGVFRRAQGLFYEASTLGNFCAFFLFMVLVSLFRRREQTPLSRGALQFGAVILAAALIFSYSRASVLNVIVAAVALACIHAGRVRRSLAVALAALAAAGGAIHLATPRLSALYWGRLWGSFSFFGQSPDQILSGRLGHWQILYDFLAREPWYAVFGVGYKTLPYSTFIGSTMIADNTYLSLLVETGVLGLAAFIGLNVVILRTAWIARRSSRPQTQFFGEWIFCFWCGEMIQMLSGDLITYWRVLPVYFWVLGTAARLAREDA